MDERISLDDAQVLSVIEKMLKQRKESIAQFEQGGRADLAAKEQAEIELLTVYLPAQLSDAEVDALIKDAIASTGAASVKDMGKVMGDREGEGCRAHRHGRGQRPHQGGALRLIRLRAGAPRLGAFNHFVLFAARFRAASRIQDDSVSGWGSGLSPAPGKADTGAGERPEPQPDTRRLSVSSGGKHDGHDRSARCRARRDARRMQPDRGVEAA